MPQVGKPSPPEPISENDLKVLATMDGVQGALPGDNPSTWAVIRLLGIGLLQFEQDKWTLTDAGKEALAAAGLSAPADAG